MINKEITCCFTGHRPGRIPYLYYRTSRHCESLRGKIAAQIERLIEKGCTNFITGMALGVDMLCAEIVLELKKTNSAIKLVCAIPYPGQASRFSSTDKSRYLKILSSADEKIEICPHYSSYCMQLRNIYMVNNSQYVIAVWDGIKNGGTWNTINYAQTQQLKGESLEIIYIDPSADNA